MSRNPIWEYFTKTDDISRAKCGECCKLLSLGSDKSGKQTVSGLKFHIQKCHNDALYVAKVDTRNDEPPAEQTYRRLQAASPVSSCLASPVTQIYSDRRSNLLGENAEKLAYNMTVYGRPLSVSGRPCYILPMFIYLFIFLMAALFSGPG